MAEAVAETIAAAAFAAGEIEAGAYILTYGAQVIQAAALISSVYTLREDQRRAQNAQRNAYNASLKDRYLMVRSAIEPRAVVLGRQRVSGPVAYIGSYGSNREHLVFALPIAAHQIDALEAVYFDDERVTLDGSGNVLAVNRRDLFTLTGAGATFTLTSAPAAGTVSATVAYGTSVVTLGVSVAGNNVTVSGGTIGQTGTVTILYQPAQSPYTSVPVSDVTTTLALDGSGNGSVVLASTPVAGSVHVIVTTGSGDGLAQTPLDAYVSVVGSTVTVTAAPIVSATATVTYQTTNGLTSKARVRSYLGAPGQAADAGMISALPGVWTSAHTLSGLAYLVVEFDYDVDAFPSGIPNVSALVRGALCYDPRTGSTVWTENPALLMRHVATHPLLGRLATAQMDDTRFAAAASICETAAAYVVNGITYNRALYTAGLVVKTTTRAKDALDDLAKAMAGRWLFSGGTLKVKAGAYVTPLQTLDDTWLASGQAVQVQTATAHADLVNDVTGRFVDQERDYVEVEYPRVVSASYLAIDGVDLPLDQPLNAVTFVGQCQQVVAAQMRDVRMGLRVTLLCNMRAWTVEVFDTLNVTLARFGWQGKVFEVLDKSWSIDGGIQLSLKATDPTIWALGTSFTATPLSANTLFPSPWQVPAIAGLTCASGTGQLLKMADGTVLTRVQVTWTAVTDALVLQGGGVDVRYGLAGTAESTWDTVTAERNQSTVYLTRNLREGLVYLVKARASNALVSGAWSAPVAHQVIGKSALPANVSGLATAALPGGVGITVTPSTELDVITGGYLELRQGGANWAAATRIFRGPADRYTWPWPAAGTYTLRAKWVDSSGNESATDSTLSVTVNAGNLIDTAQLNPNSATEIYITTPGSAFTVTKQQGVPDGYSKNDQIIAVTFTPAASGNALVHFDGRGNYTNISGSDAAGAWSIQDAGAAYDGWKRLFSASIANGKSGQFSMATTRNIAVTGGVTYTFGVYAAKFGATDTFTVDNMEMRVEIVKR